MIYITGDTHGDFSRIERFCENIPTTKDDIIIILGDAGFNYYGGWRDIHAKRTVAALPIGFSTTRFYTHWFYLQTS